MSDPVRSLDPVEGLPSVKQVQQERAQPDAAQLKKACRDFESIFVDYMMKQMRKTISRNGIMGANQAEQLYTSMLDSAVAENVSQSRGIGLASIIYKQMSGIVGTK